MSERHTPETDNNDYAYAFLEEYGYESSLQGAPVDWADFARRLESERDEALSDLEFRRGLFQLQEKQLNEVRAERDALQEQLDAAIMLGKMQERRHERELEQVREQYRLSSVCRKLLEENKQLKGEQP